MSRGRTSVLSGAAFVGNRSLWLASVVGGMTMTLVHIVRAMIPPRFDWREFMRNMYKVGVKSYLVIIVVACFTGAIMVVQSATYMSKIHANHMIGWGAGLTIFSELGPLMIGLIFSGRVGANNTAELGTMVVTEQVHALRSLAIDPVEYLVVPRFLSMVIMMTVLTVLGDLFAMIGGAITAQVMLGCDWREFLASLLDAQLLGEFVVGLCKACLFGFTIAVVSCYYGLSVRGGARGVGRAVNNAVVASAIGIFAVDYLATLLCVELGWL